MRRFRRRNKLNSIPPSIRGLPNPELQAELASVMPFLHMCCRLSVIESSVVVPPDNPKALIIKGQENIRLTDGDVWVRAVIRDEYSASSLVCRNKIRSRSQCFWIVTLNEYVLQWTTTTSEFIILIDDLSVIKEVHCLEECTEKIPNVMQHKGITALGKRNSPPPPPPPPLPSPSSCRESESPSCSCSSSDSPDASATASPNPSPARLLEIEEVPLPGVFAFGRNAEPSTSLLNSKTLPVTAANEEEAGPSGAKPDEDEDEEQLAEVWAPSVDLDEPSPSSSEISSDTELQDAKSVTPDSFYSPLVSDVASASPASLQTCPGPSQYPKPQCPTALPATEEQTSEDIAETTVRQEVEDPSAIVAVDELSDVNSPNSSDEDVSIVSVIRPHETMISASSTDLPDKENAPPSSLFHNVLPSGHVPASPPRSLSSKAVNSDSPSNAADLLNSTLWSSNPKQQNDSPLGDIYSPRHALRIMRSRPSKAARPPEDSPSPSVVTDSQTADRCKRRALSQKTNTSNDDTSSQKISTDKRLSCQPSNLRWEMQAGSLNTFTHPSKGEYLYFVRKSVREVEELRCICPGVYLSDEWLSMLLH